MENSITREVHEEFARRIDAENERQNKRIAIVEATIQQINSLTVSVERMATNMENMLEVLKQQGDRIGALEERPDGSHEQVEIAVNLRNVMESIKRQGERIGKLEMAPVETNRQMKSAIISSIISAVVGTVVGAVLVLL